MNTSEQITALLHGELTDDRSVAELMHILSVSPERRAAFLEHIKVSRQLLRSGRTIAPAPSATQDVLAKIAAMELGMMAPLAAKDTPPTDAPSESKSDWRKWSLLLLLLLSFTAGGYLFGSYRGGVEAPNPAQIAEKSATASSPSQQPAATVRQEATATLKEWKNGQREEAPVAVKATSGTNVSTLHGRIAELTGLLERERKESATLRVEINRLHLQIIVLKETIDAGSVPHDSTRTSSFAALQSGTVRDLPLIAPAEANTLSGTATSVISAEGLPRPSSSTAKSLQPWRVELRQNLRSSLPGVQGLESRAGILADREIGAGREFTAMGRSIRFGVAVGGTTFAQVYHTNTGGALNDTIIEQMPHLIYGRAYAAPRLFEGDRFSSALELGVGGTELGPVGTAGLNIEYKLADRLTLQTGVSSWLLWTSFRNQLHTSTNLNAHIGISLNP